MIRARAGSTQGSVRWPSCAPAWLGGPVRSAGWSSSERALRRWEHGRLWVGACAQSHRRLGAIAPNHRSGWRAGVGSQGERKEDARRTQAAHGSASHQPARTPAAQQAGQFRQRQQAKEQARRTWVARVVLRCVSEAVGPAGREVSRGRGGGEASRGHGLARHPASPLHSYACCYGASSRQALLSCRGGGVDVTDLCEVRLGKGWGWDR